MKGVSYPCVWRLPARSPVEADNVEARSVMLELGVPGDEPQGSSREPSLLAWVHGECCAGQAAAASTTHFDEDQDAIVQHYQVELPVPAPEVTRYRREPAADEPGFSLLLGGAT